MCGRCYISHISEVLLSISSAYHIHLLCKMHFESCAISQDYQSKRYENVQVCIKVAAIHMQLCKNYTKFALTHIVQFEQFAVVLVINLFLNEFKEHSFFKSFSRLVSILFSRDFCMLTILRTFLRPQENKLGTSLTQKKCPINSDDRTHLGSLCTT